MAEDQTMPEYVLSFKPTTTGFGIHDPSAVIFEDGVPVYGIEEERLSRRKHAENQFPERAIRACLDHCDVSLSEIDEIYLPYKPELLSKLIISNVRNAVQNPSFVGRSASTDSSGSVLGNIATVTDTVDRYLAGRSGDLVAAVEQHLERSFAAPLPPITTLEHHRCHAASAYYPADFTDGLVLTLDGRGEYDSTVVWHAANGELSRDRTYTHPNSLGHFFAAVTEFLGYRAFNGEGKIMGLAPYGEQNDRIENRLRNAVRGGVEYDVTDITTGTIEDGVNRLEDLFDRPRKRDTDDFSQWEKDFAFTAQKFVEETVIEIVREYTDRYNTSNVGLSGGVALNCKMNKRVMELDCVDNIFIQPVSHDGGLALGAGLIHSQADIDMPNIYYGPEHSTEEIINVLEKNKLEYEIPDDLGRTVAEQIADGKLIGWFQGRLEMGPRALGNRSILADPRTAASRDRVNKYVKHREEWRPFAPSMLESAADDYLINAEPSPFMIKTFRVDDSTKNDIQAVLHPADDTTRPQTVREDQNPRYYRLIKTFEDITGVPVVLNTSFNDHGEPIVTTPSEAIKDFYGMGLDTLVLGDVVVEKP
jgi:carbamoyltransferase